MNLQEKQNEAIGIFDSGIGGVTVLKEILKELPYEKYIYYSDSVNNPYGDKNQEEIQKICCNIVKYFLKRNCKAIVIACNTASAKAVEILREKYKQIPIIAIEPAYKMVYDNSYNQETLIMATKGTIESERFNSLLKKYNNNKTYIIGCTGLADAIEQGDLKKVSSLLEKEVGEYKGKVKNVSTRVKFSPGCFDGHVCINAWKIQLWCITISAGFLYIGSGLYFYRHAPFS